MADFKLNIPRSSVQSVRRSHARLRGTTGVHVSQGQLLVNGSADGLVELALDPPCSTGRTLNTMFVSTFPRAGCPAVTAGLDRFRE
jgi:hypothetical protein